MMTTVEFAHTLRRRARGALLLASFSVAAAAAAQSQSDTSVPVRLPSLTVPMSSYASDAARQALRDRLGTPPLDFLSDVAAARRYYDKFNDEQAAEMRRAYAVKIQNESFGGVATAIVVPAAGIERKNANRVLINVHGGGFLWGSGSGGLVESIPIAAVGRVKVVSVDYRLAPEHKFPAASQDVAAVYRALLETYRPENIGIYGCSAGGLLTAQSVAWFQRHNLPRPGAVATLCATGAELEGDSAYLAGPLTGERAGHDQQRIPLVVQLPYFAGVDPKDPLVFPIQSRDVIARFPPTLLAAGSRDFAASSLTVMHRRLSSAGVHAELFMFDGLWHAFMVDHKLPESQELYSILTSFFDRQLGRKPK